MNKMKIRKRILKGVGKDADYFFMKIRTSSPCPEIEDMYRAKYSYKISENLYRLYEKRHYIRKTINQLIVIAKHNNAKIVKIYK